MTAQELQMEIADLDCQATFEAIAGSVSKSNELCRQMQAKEVDLEWLVWWES